MKTSTFMMNAMVTAVMLMGMVGQAHAAKDVCFTSKAEMQTEIRKDKTRRLLSILGDGRQYFDVWQTGFMNAGKIRVAADGTATFDILGRNIPPTRVQLCVGGDSGRAFVVFFGKPYYFDNQGNTKITLEDPQEKGKFHTFVSGVQ